MSEIGENKEKLRNMPAYKCANRGKMCKWPHLEEKVAKWISESRESGYIITRNAIRLFAIKLARKEGIPEFIATPGWCSRFMNSHNLVLRRKTKIAQKLPKELDDKVIKFHKFVIKCRKKNKYDLACIGNMDETPVWFDMPSNSTVHKAGEKTIFVKTTGHEKSHFTVVLSCMANGKKLMPMVIFKRKLMPKEKFPKGIIVHVHPKGWMDEEGCKIWIAKVWRSRPGGLKKEKSLLVWDMFRSHRVDSVIKSVRLSNTDVAVIPGGLTSVLQPLDVSLNKPFKDRLREKWNTWMLEGEKSFTKGGAMRAPALPTLCTWVKESWDAVGEDLVIRAFKKCGISNSLDGTEDDILYADEGTERESDVGSIADDELYDDDIDSDEFNELFSNSHIDEPDFDGF